MQFEQYFPLGIAKGAAFIGREEEAQWLNKNIDAGIHTLLLAPRRYGKSSLVLHTLENNHLDYIELDLQLCRSAKAIEKKIIHGVEHIITSVIKEKESLLHTAKTFFKKANMQWKIGFKGFVELTIEPERNDDPAENILTALQFLEAALAIDNKRAIIYIDEVQEITQVELTTEIQGAIRHFAQKAKLVVFVFSGSNRRMLRHMFNDNAMPLYQLCDNIILGKIPTEVYKNYLDHVAKLSWGTVLIKEVFDEIIRLSDRHPRRIYNLCLYLWRMVNGDKKQLNADNVQKAWQKLITAEAKSIRYFLSKMNTGQLKVIAYISFYSGKELASKNAQRITNLSSTAIYKALHKLEEDDLIERNEDDGYHLIDPVVKETIIQYEREIIDI